MGEIVLQGPYRRDRCFSFGSLFVGSTGGAALGYVTKIFDPKAKVDKLTIELKSDALLKNKFLRPLQNIQLGGNYYWRVGTQIVGAMILYSFIECKFQGGWPRRSMLDCMLAGGITGGAFGLRGVPGGRNGAGLCAGGFAAYAGLMYLLFRRR